MSKELIRLVDCTMAFDDEVVLDNITLNIHDIFRSKQVFRTINMRTEHDPLFRDFPTISQRKNLKTATIRKDRTIP